MNMIYVLYNESSGAHYSKEEIKEKIKAFFSDASIEMTDTMTVDNKQEYVDKITKDDKLVIVGGDGTLNHFINGVEDRDYDFDIYCYAAGTGNDFINDVNGVKTDELVHFNEYMKNLPEISVKGKNYRFINGIGYGIDGYCCEEGDNYRKKTGKAPNYTSIAIKGLLYKFKPTNAKVIIDGVSREFKNVWMVPSMNGRYFGGGMMITPSQDRLNEQRDLSFVVVTSKSRIRLLTVFPKIFEGGHVKYTKLFKQFSGKEIEVEFDRPVALQIDGETVLGVTSYRATSYALKKEEATV